MSHLNLPARKALVLTAAMVAAPALAAAAGPPAAFVVDWYTVDGGGGTSGGGGFQLEGTIGQPDAGVATGGDFVLSGGFWAGGANTTPPCPEDLDGDGTVDFDDLLGVLASFGECAGCPSDFDVDGDVDFDDLLLVLAVFGPCPS